MPDKPNATLGPISEREIHQFFVDFRNKSTVRKRPIPTVEQCVEIAQTANMFCVPSRSPRAGRGAFDRWMKGTVSSGRETTLVAKDLSRELKKYVDRLNDFPGTQDAERDSDWSAVLSESLDRSRKLLDSVSDFLAAEGADDPKTKRPPFWGIDHVRRKVGHALKEVGWKNVSEESDLGPVNFVLGKIIFQLTGENVKASTLGRAKRRRKKTKAMA